MLALIGDILNGLAVGVLFPLLMLPLASFARGRLGGAVLSFMLASSVFAASVVFAALAVDIDPPRATAGLIAAVAIGTGGIFLLAASAGAAALVQTLAPPIAALVRGVGRLSLYLIVAMALLQFSAVVLRYVFGLNFIALQESVTYLHGAVFLLAGGYALLTDDHVRVDIFYREASPRRKAIVDLAGTYLFLFPFCFVALWAAAPYVANSWAVREGSVEQSGIAGVYLLKTLIPVYLTLLALAGFVVAARATSVLKADGR